MLALLCTVMLARTTGAGDVATRFGHGASEVCRGCHPHHHEEWIRSVHASADRKAEIMAMRETLRVHGDLQDRACRSCHGTDLTVVLGMTALEHPVRLSHAAERTVTCTVCHQITEPLRDHELPLRENAPHGEPVPCDNRGPDADFGQAFHESKPMDRLRGAGTCGPCHEVRAPNGLRLERTYSQYLESVYPQRDVTCSTCHMSSYGGAMVPGGVLREQLHRHDMIGTDVFVNTVPAMGSQRFRVQRFLAASAALFVEPPEGVVPGRPLDLTVEIVNSGAGHNLPAGRPAERRLWVEIELRADDGRLLHRSGYSRRPEARLAMDSGSQAADSEALIFTDRFVDASGREVAFWWQADRIEERSLKAHERRRVTCRLPPLDLDVGRSVEFTVRLRFQACSPRQLALAGLESLVASYPVFDLRTYRSGPVPVVERLIPEGTVRVPEDVADLHEALDRVPAGGTVLVGPGVHVLERPLVFGSKPVTLRSREGAEHTVLRRRFTGPDEQAENGSVLVFGPDGGRSSRLDGFTIRGGQGMRRAGRRLGGGVFCLESSPTLVASRFVRNDAVDGGGLYFEASRASLRRCRIEENRASGDGGGIAVAGASRILVVRTLLHANRAGGAGGGIHGGEGTVLISEARLQGNRAERGGGLALGGGERQEAPDGRSALHRVWVLGNAAVFGGGMELSGGAPLLERVVLAGNVARLGGAGYIGERAAPEMVNITVTENLAPSWGAFRVREGGQVRIRNAILWGNEPATLAGDITYSLVDDPGFLGGTNIGGFPLFSAPGSWTTCRETDEPGCVPVRWGRGRPPQPVAYARWVPGNYRLILGSAAIDAGFPGDVCEADGSRRDMGAIWREQPLEGFRRGDVNGDGVRDLADAQRLGRFLLATDLLSPDVPPCLDAADLDDDGQVTTVDLYLGLRFHFGLGRRPAEPFPGCGLDPSPDDRLGCFESPPGCP